MREGCVERVNDEGRELESAFAFRSSFGLSQNVNFEGYLLTRSVSPNEFPFLGSCFSSFDLTKIVSQNHHPCTTTHTLHYSTPVAMGRSRSFGSDADDKERLAASLLGQKPQLPLWSLIAITLPWFGVQFSWSAGTSAHVVCRTNKTPNLTCALHTEFATQTSYILSLGVPKTFTTWTWAAGAVTGFLVQPIVGSFSDR